MDLVAVDIGSSSKRLYSFLAVAWGIISDVDIGSEKYRSLGNSRFAVEAFAKIAGKYLLEQLFIRHPSHSRQWVYRTMAL